MAPPSNTFTSINMGSLRDEEATLGFFTHAVIVRYNRHEHYTVMYLLVSFISVQ